jgi:hypothetical protein
MGHPPDPCVSSAGRTTCLRCEQPFRSWDRRRNRLCPRCRQALSARPSDEPRHRLPTRRHLTPEEGVP